MLPKHRRLTALQVREVLKEGYGRRATYLSMRLQASKVPLKGSAVASKKVAPGAVERNRLRRAVYRALRSPTLSVLGHSVLNARGSAVIFVQKIPKEDLSGVFAQDIALLFKNISI